MFTSWKQLGKEEGGCFWSSHTKKGKPSLLIYRPGFAYSWYEEKNERRTLHNCIYRPEISMGYTIATVASEAESS